MNPWLETTPKFATVQLIESPAGKLLPNQGINSPGADGRTLVPCGQRATLCGCGRTAASSSVSPTPTPEPRQDASSSRPSTVPPFAERGAAASREERCEVGFRLEPSGLEMKPTLSIKLGLTRIFYIFNLTNFQKYTSNQKICRCIPLSLNEMATTG